MPYGAVIYVYARCICSPLFKIFILALVSRLCTAWQPGHSQLRTARFFTAVSLYPQQEHVWLLGYSVGTFTTSFPYQAALYASIPKNFDHDAEPMCSASLWLRIIFLTPQVLYADGLVFTDQHGGLFLQEIIPLVRNLLMDGSDFHTLPVTVIGAFLFP